MTRYTFSIANDTLNGVVNNTTLLLAIRSDVGIVIAVDNIATSGDDLYVDFRSDLDAPQIAILDALVAAHTGAASPDEPQQVSVVANSTVARDADSNQKISIQPRVGSGTTIITHNFGDPCSWFTNSVLITDEILTTKVNAVYDVYKCSKTNIIDTEHGRLTFDNRIDTKYKIIVKVNDVVVTTGFAFNYELGEITFLTPLTVSDVVKLTFYYATDSEYVIKATAGKKLKIENVEVQFSSDVDMQGKTECHFEEWGYNPNNLPNKMLYKTTIYKNIANFIDESNNKYFSTIPPRDNLTAGLDIFVWEYPVSRQIKNSEGAEVRISMVDVATGVKTIPIKNKDGNNLERATTAFYCVSETE
jgi:hypothetical protein